MCIRVRLLVYGERSWKLRFGAYLKRVIAKSFDLVMFLIARGCILQTQKIRIGVANVEIRNIPETAKPACKGPNGTTHNP